MAEVCELSIIHCQHNLIHIGVCAQSSVTFHCNKDEIPQAEEYRLIAPHCY